MNATTRARKTNAHTRILCEFHLSCRFFFMRQCQTQFIEHTKDACNDTIKWDLWAHSPNKLITCIAPSNPGRFFGIESSKFSLINTKRLISRDANRHPIPFHAIYLNCTSMCTDLIFVEVQWQRFWLRCRVNGKTTSAANQNLLIFMSLLWSSGSREKVRVRACVHVVLVKLRYAQGNFMLLTHVTCC